MRALRAFLVGTAILAVLGSGLGRSVVAQSSQAGTDGDWPKLEEPVAYGTDNPARQVIWVERPEPRETPRAAVVMFHPGGLVMGEPLWDADRARWIAEQGYVVFMAGYRLFNVATEKNPWPAQLDDAQHAVRWIRAHADEYGIDPDRLCAMGGSSGGHLAGLVGTTESTNDSDLGLEGISSRVDCVVSVAGDADLTVPYTNPRWTGVFEKMLGAALEEDPAAWRAASPAWHVDEETPPFLIIQGNHDEEVPVQMARNLADALAAAGREYVFAEVPTGHMDVLDPEATSRLIETFLAYQLHPER
jgi:acetyl esterase/lipase